MVTNGMLALRTIDRTKVILTLKLLYGRRLLQMKQGLTENIVKNAAARDRKYYLSDGRGLLLEINPNNAKYWIVRLYAGKKEFRRSIGSYPEVTLKQARQKAFELKMSNSLNLDRDMTFGEAYKAFYDYHYARLTEMHRETIESRWRNYIAPKLESMPLSRITSQTIVKLCSDIIKEGHYETARRVRIIISQVFNFVMAQNIITTNPAANLSDILPTRPAKHFPCITEPEDISMLMRSITAYPHRITRLALLFSARTFCRPGEIRHAEWREIDLPSGQWVIPSQKMKMKRDHIVPLSSQNIDLLYELRGLTGRGQWLFPSARSCARPLSEGTLRVALRSIGYTNEQMTPHGFRSMASTVLNTYGWPKDYIELQLSHVDNSIRGIYNRSIYLTQRRYMMQWWSDYLDSRITGAQAPAKPTINIFD